MSRGRRTRHGGGRKTLMLCRQVQRALDLALCSEHADERLLSARVESVTPAPDAGRLHVEVVLPASASDEEVSAARHAVAGTYTFLRAQVAEAINRRKTPELAIEVSRESS